jgi:hypothetical protein
VSEAKYSLPLVCALALPCLSFMSPRLEEPGSKKRLQQSIIVLLLLTWLSWISRHVVSLSRINLFQINVL